MQRRHVYCQEMSMYSLWLYEWTLQCRGMIYLHDGEMWCGILYVELFVN